MVYGGLEMKIKAHPYIIYDFCSICFTVLHELYPQDTILAHNNKLLNFIESDYVYHTDRFDNIIKNNPIKLNIFEQQRKKYINYLDDKIV